MAVFFADFTTKWTSCRSNFFHVLPSPININWILGKGCQSEVLFLLRAYAFNDIINKKSRPGEVGRGCFLGCRSEAVTPTSDLRPSGGCQRVLKSRRSSARARKSVASALTSFVILSTLSPPFGGMPQAASLDVLSASPTSILPCTSPYYDTKKKLVFPSKNLRPSWRPIAWRSPSGIPGSVQLKRSPSIWRGSDLIVPKTLVFRTTYYSNYITYLCKK